MESIEWNNPSQHSLYFGRGIVKSLDDFGTQGAWPTHPELLDTLAVDFMESDWNVKRMVKQIVMSQTYQQSSRTTPEIREVDPDNQWLARQARFLDRIRELNFDKGTLLMEFAVRLTLEVSVRFTGDSDWLWKRPGSFSPYAGPSASWCRCVYLWRWC